MSPPTCTVGDRGPFITGRVIDLFRDDVAIAQLSAGVISVHITW